jgi:hypothetical protein
MTDTTMDTPDTHHGHGGLKVKMPDLFYGDRSKLEDWILQFDRHFHIEGDKIEDVDKVILVSTYMKGPAEKWVLPIIRKYMDPNSHDAGNTVLVEQWDAFKIRLRQIFSPFKESVIAEQKIQELKQTHSAADYTNIFQQYAEQIQWDNAALMRMYKQGLKPALLAELMRSGQAINDLEDLTNEAIRLDNELFELKLAEQSYRKGTGRTHEESFRPKKSNGRYQPNHGRQRNTYQPRLPGVYRSNGPERMHLSNINTKPNNSKKEWKKNDGPETRSCYNCGKPGHLARNCRSKNKVVRQINMITGSQEEDAEEWTVVHGQYQVERRDDVLSVETGTTDIREEGQVLVDADWELERLIRHYEEASGQAEQMALKRHLDNARYKGTITYDPGCGYYVTNETPEKKQARLAARQAQHEVLRKICAEMETTDETIKEGLKDGSIVRTTTRPGFKINPNWKDDQETMDQAKENQAQQEWIDQQIREGNLSKTQGTQYVIKNGLWSPDPTNNMCVPENEEPTRMDDQELQAIGKKLHEQLNQLLTIVGEERSLADEEPREYRFRTLEKLAKRPETPHPGTKVPTVWDYENYEEADNAEERALTPEELDIHSPPASPKLSRQSTSRGYANEKQALVIHDITKARQRDLMKEDKEYHRTIRYLRDPRNLLHGKIEWTACASNYCPIHYETKENASYFPVRKGCKWQWSECGTHKCPYHLWDKRTSGHFPDLTAIEVSAQYASLLDGSCLLSTWQLCLDPKCARHKQDKLENGFLDDKTFLGSRNQSDDDNYETAEDQSEDEASTHQAIPAPGTTPEAATRYLQDLSLDSQ